MLEEAGIKVDIYPHPKMVKLFKDWKSDQRIKKLGTVTAKLRKRWGRLLEDAPLSKASIGVHIFYRAGWRTAPVGPAA